MLRHVRPHLASAIIASMLTLAAGCDMPAMNNANNNQNSNTNGNQNTNADNAANDNNSNDSNANATPDNADNTNDNANDNDGTDVDVVIIEPDDNDNSQADDDMKTPDDDGLTEAIIRRRGYERILVGPDLDPDFGFPVDPDFSVNEFIFDLFNQPFALSGDGQKLWFRLYAPFSVEGEQRVQLWCINTNGTGALRSTLPDDDLTNGLHLVTNEDGSIVYANNTSEGIMYRAEPGKPATVAFDYAGDLDFDRNFNINDEGTSMILGNLGRFAGEASIYTVVLSTGTGTPVETLSNDALALSGVNPRSLANGEFDVAGDVAQSVFRANYNSSTLTPTTQDVVYVGRGGTTNNLLQRPFDDTASDIQITDDGNLVAYCLDAPLGEPNTCVIEDLINISKLEFGDGRTGVGRMVLADNGTRLYYRSNACCDSGSGILQELGTSTRRPAGSKAFYNTTGYSNAQLSDDGNTLAAVISDTIYILRDGASEPGSFPGVLGISYRNNGDCTLTVRACTISPGGLAGVTIEPWFDGVDPTESIEDGENNPLFSIRSTRPLALNEGTVNDWEITFGLTNSSGQCVEDLLTPDFNLRIVTESADESAASWADFSPLD